MFVKPVDNVKTFLSLVENQNTDTAKTKTIKIITMSSVLGYLFNLCLFLLNIWLIFKKGRMQFFRDSISKCCVTERENTKQA